MGHYYYYGKAEFVAVFGDPMAEQQLHITTIYDVIDRIREMATSESQKGDYFELACRFYLLNDPALSQVVGKTWLWDDWPENGGKPDTGIDIVSEDPESAGHFWAVQCKCYLEDNALPYGECSTFWGTAGPDTRFARYMLFTTTDNLSANLLTQIASTNTVLITPQNMAEANVDWDAFLHGAGHGEHVTFDPRPHQVAAIEDINREFDDVGADRTKAILACGTGKTLMSLRLAESRCPHGNVLFAAPSIALVAQSLREWANQARVRLLALAVCSDSKASDLTTDGTLESVMDLGFPATTDPAKVAANAARLRAHDPDAMIVIFSTYQSMQVIQDAQALGLPAFDLIVCDEAHRTTGFHDPSLPEDERPAFQIVHDEERVHGAKRLYMTATERIYGDSAKEKAKQHAGRTDAVVLASMDDESIYGRTCHELKFAKAIDADLLCDYRVVVLAVHEETLPADVRARLHEAGAKGDNNEIALDDYAKVIGCYKALATHGVNQDVLTIIDPNDPLAEFLSIEEDDGERVLDTTEIEPLHRAVGFCGTIAMSKDISREFPAIVSEYLGHSEDAIDLDVVCRHVDGTMNSKQRGAELAWLADECAGNECRMLTNARCLSEGVDVPSLDAAIFFAPRKSVIDVVQAVGRVMRTFTNPKTGEKKKLGYIILPVFIPAGRTPEEALGDSKTFDVVWKVLQALRSHDERLEARVNSLQLARKKDKPKIGRGTTSLGANQGTDQGDGGEGAGAGTQMVMDLSATEGLQDAIYATLVQKVGTRIYWDTWADDVARIAQRHIEQINAAIESDEAAREGMDSFLTGLRESLNPGITQEDAVEMVAQHMITLPVFEALFGDFEFSRSNPVSIAIDEFLDGISGHGVGEMDASDHKALDELYSSVRLRASMVVNDAGRQELIKNLYNEFFKAAFKSTSDKLGIVYTPNEIVEFILRFSDKVLRREFGKGIADEGVHVLDPFAGTGTFMARLIESDLIPDDKLAHKYLHELHSNEILLLAYYIMVVNIEYAYHSRTGEYVAYPLALLTDTFQMTEDDDTIDESLFIDNSIRKLEQNDLNVWLCCGNPPYSNGQTSANDNNANEHYETLENRIRESYIALSTAGSTKSLMDSYIKAFRWASDRITRHGDSGVVAFVTNAGWLRTAAGEGIRRCFVKEFNCIYVYDLRGNQRTQGEESRREGGKVFDSGSRAPIAVTVLVKNPSSSEHGVIRYFDVGDYKSRFEKLEAIGEASQTEPEWTIITPDRHGDWLNQRNDAWYDLVPVGVLDGSKKTPFGIWEIWSLGIGTNRDAWSWNYSSEVVAGNVSRLIDNMNAEVEKVKGAFDLKEFDSTKYSWVESTVTRYKRGERLTFAPDTVIDAVYRPFCRQYLYFEGQLVHRMFQQERLFPLKAPHETFDNVVIALTNGSKSSCLVTNHLPDLHFVGDSQCFPLYWYEKDEGGSLFLPQGEKALRDAWGNRYVRHDGITDRTLEVFRSAYPTAFHDRQLREGPKELTKADIFHFVYGILHSPEYRAKYEANLQKELPRIPLVEEASFETFVRAGYALAELHLGYEAVEPWPNLMYSQMPDVDPGPVTKMVWGKRRNPETKKMERDYAKLVYNANLTISNIPERAQEYVVNGRSPLDWMIDRYQVKTDKNTGIVNDPNEYSDDPLYIVKLIGSLVTVSMRTLDIIDGLPPIREIEHPDNWPAEWAAQQ